MFTLFCFCLFCFVLWRSFLAIYNYQGVGSCKQKNENGMTVRAQHLCEEDHRQMDEEKPFDDFPGRTFLKRFGIPLAVLIGWLIFYFQN